MNQFYETLKNTGILQGLRKMLDEKDKAAFDDKAAEILAEYSNMWTEMHATVNDITGQVKNNGKRTESHGDKKPDGEHRQPEKPNDV